MHSSSAPVVITFVDVGDSEDRGVVANANRPTKTKLFYRVLLPLYTCWKGKYYNLTMAAKINEAHEHIAKAEK